MREDFTEFTLHGGYKLINVYGPKSPELRQRIANFWLENGAIKTPTAARSRLPQVVYIAEKSGEIVGVNTAYKEFLDIKGFPAGSYYIYRNFIAKSHRVPMMTITMFLKMIAFFEANKKGDDRGIIMIADNEKLNRKGSVKHLKKHDFQYAGNTPSGKKMYIKVF